MPLRFSVGSIVLALALWTIGARADAAVSMIYTIDDHDRQVTIIDGSGKTLLSCRAATPTIQAVVVKKPLAADPSQHQAVLTLEDQNGKQLWTTVVPVISPMTFHFDMGTTIRGVRLSFVHDQKPDTDSDGSGTSRLVFVIGPDGRPISMDMDGKVYKIAIGPGGASILTPEGKMSLAAGPSGITATGPTGPLGGIHLTPTGGTMEVNGTTISITRVERDGKPYYAFPWNGHQIFVGVGCTFSANSDGDLTIDGPAGATKKP